MFIGMSYQFLVFGFMLLTTSDKSIDIVHEDQNIIVVNKPSSMPIHPCGQYHHNTLVKILHNEKGMKNLRVIHRLDRYALLQLAQVLRMTSGLVLIGKTYDAAMKISSQISDREVIKVGHFIRIAFSYFSKLY